MTPEGHPHHPASPNALFTGVSRAFDADHTCGVDFRKRHVYAARITGRWCMDRHSRDSIAPQHHSMPGHRFAAPPDLGMLAAVALRYWLGQGREAANTASSSK